MQKSSSPEAKPLQVRVRLEGCGICGSNLALRRGHPWFKLSLRARPQGWRTVDQLGAEVKNIRIGERVALLSNNAFAEYDVAAGAGARVIAISRRPFALEMARRCGASETLALENHDDIAARVMALTGAKGCAIEAAGTRDSRPGPRP